MNVDDFKKIFWMEWGHRQLGRTIGLAFILPASFFVAKGWVTRPMAARLVGLGGLIGLQVSSPPPRDFYLFINELKFF